MRHNSFLVSFLLIVFFTFHLTAQVKGAITSQPDYKPALQAEGYKIPEIHSRTDITAQMKTLETLSPGEPYFSSPSFKSPYKPGKLNQAFLDHGLATLNFYRYLTGLSYDIVLDKDWVNLAQYGAALLRIINRGLSHTPAYPSGIGLSRDFYQQGYAATSTSNLHQGQGDLGKAVSGFIDDSDPSNIDRVGHRRWALFPGLTKTGFGFADGYVAMRVFEGYSTTDYAYTAWPPAGELPLGYFNNNMAWTFSLNPETFGGQIRGSKNSVKVTVTRLRDKKTWKFGGSDSSGGYFNIDTQGFGLAYCLIFRPKDLGIINDGDKFQIDITGIQDANGKEIPISYLTGFFNTGPSIVSTIASTNPKKPYFEYYFDTSYRGKEGGKETKSQLTFGYVGLAIRGFSLYIDTPSGIVPLGCEINRAEKIVSPGDWISDPSGKIWSLKFIPGAAGYNITYAVYNQKKGWSNWADAGQELSFGKDFPIETISVIVE